MVEKRKEEPKAGAPEWMCTFSDMMSLLLCFFVLLFALSTIEEKKFIQLAGAFRDAFGGRVAPFPIENIPVIKSPIHDMSKNPQPIKKKAYGKDKLLSRLKQMFRSLKLDQISAVKGTEKGIQFTLLGDALFDRWSAVIRPEAYAFLQDLGETLRDLPDNPLKFSGHTDNGPPPPKKMYADKWALSMARARALMVYFHKYEAIDNSRMSYEGYADTVPAKDEKDRPIPADTEEGRAQQRRVEITLLQSEENADWFMITREEEAAPTPVPEPEPV
ncbi:MAG: flagellar motor protein MotB [bacterium]